MLVRASFALTARTVFVLRQRAISRVRALFRTLSCCFARNVLVVVLFAYVDRALSRALFHVSSARCSAVSRVVTRHSCVSRASLLRVTSMAACTMRCPRAILIHSLIITHVS